MEQVSDGPYDVSDGPYDDREADQEVQLRPPSLSLEVSLAADRAKTEAASAQRQRRDESLFTSVFTPP